MKTVFVRSAFNYDMNAASDETALHCLDVSLAKQSFAEECDINTIVRRFNLTGELPSNVVAPTYADFEDIFDFHSAMNVVAQAHEAFGAMPAETRARFHNDPAEFLDFFNNEENRAEAVKMGLVVPPPQEPFENPSKGGLKLSGDLAPSGGSSDGGGDKPV